MESYQNCLCDKSNCQCQYRDSRCVQPLWHQMMRVQLYKIQVEIDHRTFNSLRTITKMLVLMLV